VGGGLANSWSIIRTFHEPTPTLSFFFIHRLVESRMHNSIPSPKSLTLRFVQLCTPLHKPIRKVSTLRLFCDPVRFMGWWTRGLTDSFISPSHLCEPCHAPKSTTYMLHMWTYPTLSLGLTRGTQTMSPFVSPKTLTPCHVAPWATLLMDPPRGLT
jgi:hypothetical protein